MADNNKTLVRFNVQNIKFATPNESGFNTPVAYGTATKMALQADSSVKKIFGDGRRICSIVKENKDRKRTCLN